MEPTKKATKEAIRRLVRAGRTRAWIAGQLFVGERSIGNWIAGTVTPHPRAFRELLDLAEKETK